MILTGKIRSYDGIKLVIIPDEDISMDAVGSAGSIEIRLDDGRRISADQRKKIFAVIRDISKWCGHDPEYLRMLLTWDFCGQSGHDWFSLSDVDMTTARQFIDYLIEFCFQHDVPTTDTMLNRTDDIDRYLYLCLEHRKCAICNMPADVHHVDTVGMGRNREEIMHRGMKAIALCRNHHIQAHGAGQRTFFEKYHVYGIELDEKLCINLGLKRE